MEILEKLDYRKLFSIRTVLTVFSSKAELSMLPLGSKKNAELEIEKFKGLSFE